MRQSATPEGELLRLRSVAQRASRTGTSAAGRFLPLSAMGDASRIGRDALVHASFFGGYDQAERVQVCYHPPDVTPVFTGAWVRIRWNGRFAHPDHRSLLGSLLALGMERSTLGDLVMEDEGAYLYGLPDILATLPMEWISAGKTTITVTLLDAPPTIAPAPGIPVRDTVSSLRLDAVLASGLNVSRSAASDMIRQGLVMVDHLPEARADHLLSTGSLLSIRGHGRIRLTEVLPPNRKQRIPVVMEKWVSTR